MTKWSPREIKQFAHVFMAEIREECWQADSNVLPLDNKVGEKAKSTDKQICTKWKKAQFG